MNSERLQMNKNGFSLLEVTIAMAILSITMGLALFIFHLSSGSFQETDVSAHLTERLQEGINKIRIDLRESSISTVSRYSFVDPNFGSTVMHILTMAAARDADNTFQVDSNYKPDWQGVVVYCPYKNGGAKELRRYTAYGNYAFPFSFPQDPTDVMIHLEDDNGTIVKIKRKDGIVATGGSGGIPAYRVVSNMLMQVRVTEAEDPVTATITVEGRKRNGEMLVRELKTYVHPEN